MVTSSGTFTNRAKRVFNLQDDRSGDDSTAVVVRAKFAAYPSKPGHAARSMTVCRDAGAAPRFLGAPVSPR